MNDTDNDYKESLLAAEAVDLSHQEARKRGLPRYYVKDGYLVKELNGKIEKLRAITRNQIYG